MTRILATVSSKGQLRPYDVGLWNLTLGKLRGKNITVTIEREGEKRSDPQNRRYWGVIVPTVGAYLSLNRTVPLSKDQTHYVLASAFVGCEETPLGLVPCSTKTLSVAQFSTYMEKIEAHFRAAPHKLVFPDDPVEDD